jgi:hypothetical protein
MCERSRGLGSREPGERMLMRCSKEEEGRNHCLSSRGLGLGLGLEV